MIKVIRWIILIWTLLIVIPLIFDGDDTTTLAFIYTILILGLTIHDLKK